MEESVSERGRVKVLILGASGIVGQHMRLCIPPGVEPIWVRKVADTITRGVAIDSFNALVGLLEEVNPDVVVNLAGESSVDVVERTPYEYDWINVGAPRTVAEWCQASGKRMIQVSSQAVFKGDKAPYSEPHVFQHYPVNEYGHQKLNAEALCREKGATVIRLSFILGIRALPHVGRQNPLEAMLAGQSPQVADRWFSPLMAWDAAEAIWSEIFQPSGERVLQFGIPKPWSRYQIAQLVNPDVNPCRHEDFAGIAQRPLDTTYEGTDNRDLAAEIAKAREDALNHDRAIELALFFGIHVQQVIDQLGTGFGPLHNAVSDSFRAANPQTDEELLVWYRTTDAYIWELSAYHEDAGFNYSGMCDGIAECLKSNGMKRVLCLGDGIGDLTLTLQRAGFEAYYHDLTGSRTAEYARFRYWRQTGNYPPVDPSRDWDALQSFGQEREFYDAVIALDFLEHVPNVEEWVQAVHAALRPGGLMMAKNAFGKGSGCDGAMPMHLSINDRYADLAAWEALCRNCRFELYDPATPDWWRSPAA